MHIIIFALIIYSFYCYYHHDNDYDYDYTQFRPK